MTGCIISPPDGTIVSSTSRSINFSGYHPYANSPVRIKAFNFRANQYEVISSGRSSGTAIPTGYWDDTLYSWSATSTPLGSQYWKAGRCGGAKAQIKGETDVFGGTYGMYSSSLSKNAEGCTTNNRNNSDWVRRCSSSQSILKTADYNDSPRRLGVSVNRVPQIDPTCRVFRFEYNYPSGQWRDVRGALNVGGTNYRLSCTDTQVGRNTTFGSCTFGLSDTSRVQGFIEGLQRATGTLNISATDNRCSARLRASGRFWVQSSTYDYNWSRWSANHSQCIAPPPTSTPDLRAYPVQCYCESDNGYRSPVSIAACLDARATYPQIGGQLTCDQVARDFERSSGVNTTCAYVSRGAVGQSCPVEGAWVFVQP